MRGVLTILCLVVCEATATAGHGLWISWRLRVGSAGGDGGGMLECWVLNPEIEASLVSIRPREHVLHHLLRGITPAGCSEFQFHSELDAWTHKSSLEPSACSHFDIGYLPGQPCTSFPAALCEKRLGSL